MARPLVLRGLTCHAHDDDGGGLSGLAVHLNASTAAPGESSEAYTLDLEQGAAAVVLVVSSYAGLLRGLETFSQLVTVVSTALRLPATIRVQDAPSFEHRGILLDTARNFMPLATLEQTIDALMMSKMNGKYRNNLHHSLLPQGRFLGVSKRSCLCFSSPPPSER